MDIVAVVGNPNPGGRTTRVAEGVAQKVAAMSGGRVETIELAHVADELFRWESSRVKELTTRVAGADLAVFASPTYKASMTGLLKAFLDRYGNNGLAGLVAIPVMVGGSLQHSLAVETQLRPVLVELAAALPTKGLYVVDSELDELAVTLELWWQHAGPALGRMLGVTG
ncbi:MAG: NADPH-dependent FMN reductase [Acidimicrobiia bacterium]